MCGLWVSLTSEADPERDEAALNALSHRGPDGAGLARIRTPAGILTLGHRRLAIYDLSSEGHQPMVRGPITVLLNGSLYNHRTVRADLERSGAKFTGTSDTEVLAEAWLRYEVAALELFSGMYAVVVYDARSKSLTLARDRFGEKPLHICRVGRQIWASSEIPSLLAGRPRYLPRRLNTAVMRRFLDYGIAESSDKTFIEGIERLLPGETRAFNLADNSLQAKTSYIASTQLEVSPTLPTCTPTMLRDALQASVAERMSADVPVGACLSGGLDSSMIVRSLALLNPETLHHCFTATFAARDLQYPTDRELAFAEAASNLPNLTLHVVQPSASDMFKMVSETIRRQGEPFASTSVLAQAFVFQAAAQAGITVMLDGQGADELFGGYLGVIAAALADVWQSDRSQWAEAVDAAVSSGLLTNARSAHQAIRNAIWPEPVRRALSRLRSRWPPYWQVTRAPFEYLPKPKGWNARVIGDFLERELLQQVKVTSLPSLLRYEDRNAMRFGIETRLPFLSGDVAQIAARLPSNMKVKGGRLKYILREAARGLVPDEIVDRKDKVGFAAPLSAWIERPDWKSWFKHGVETSMSRFGGILNAEKVVEVSKISTIDHVAATILFRLACAGHWADEYGVVH